MVFERTAYKNKEFKKSHIPNAIFFDIEKNSDQNSKLPHMISQKSLFEKYINENGISKKKLIVIYDQVGFFVQPEFVHIQIFWI